MSSINNIRYSIYPQMREYDSMAPVQLVPYAMLAGPSLYDGNRIKTDKHGFRITRNFDISYTVENIEKYDEVNIIIGGSTVFGVGATSDDKTISSILSISKNEIWLNLGIRACNSFQEIIHLNRFLYKSKKVKKIVVFSGANDLYLRLVNDFDSDFDYGFGTKFSSIANFHPYKQALSVFFGSIYNIEPVEIIQKKLYEIIFWPIFKRHDKTASKKVTITLEEKINRFIDVYKRNFEIYSGISKIHQCEVHFILQPLIFWSGKEISKNESSVLEYLDELQRGDYWAEVKKTLSEESIKNKIVENLNSIAAYYNISFFNSNSLFKGLKEDCFVDSVHLTDYGNKVIAEYLLKC